MCAYVFHLIEGAWTLGVNFILIIHLRALSVLGSL